MHIRTKLITTYAGLSLLLLAGADIGISLKLESYFEDRLVADLSRTADGAALMLSHQRTTPVQELDGTLRRFAELENVRLTLIRDDGRVVLDSEVPLERLSSLENHLTRPEVKQAMNGELGKNIRRSASVGRDFLYVAKRVTLPEIEGASFVRVSVHLENLQQAVSEIRWNVAMAGLGVFIIVLAVSVVLSRMLSKPMMDIARDAEEIRRGDLSRHIKVKSSDETAEVARAVNELVDKLNDDIAQLKKLERIRSEFLGNVSHELRTPLFSMQGYLETLIDGAVDDPSVNKTFLQKSLNHAQRLNMLLEDLIDISRIESGDMKMSLRFFRLADFLQSVVEDYTQAAKARGIELKLDLQVPPATEAFGDKERLRQVMANLVDNAIKYNRPNGSVSVRTTLDAKRIRIDVVDSGVGIPMEHLPRIFERFYRVDKDRSREVGGTGLGLAIVKHILEAHQTIIRVTSEPGKGTTFSFDLKA